MQNCHAALVQKDQELIGCSIDFTPIVGWPGKIQVISRSLATRYGDPRWPSTRRSRVRPTRCCCLDLSRGHPRAHGWIMEPARCSILHIHTYKTSFTRSQVATLFRSWGKLNNGISRSCRVRLTVWGKKWTVNLSNRNRSMSRRCKM